MLDLITFRQQNLTFIGENICLSLLEECHATEEYVGWLNDPQVNQFLATKSATLPELKKYIVLKNAQFDTLFFGIFLKKSGQLIGTIKLEPIDVESKKATIAIMIGNQEYWGKGLGCEAMQLLINYCFDKLQLIEVNLGVLAQNIRAIKAYKKLGFQEQHREMGAITYSNGVFDQLTMVLKRNA